MSKSEYTLVLPAFTIGIHAYDAIGKITKHFGKKVVIIGGKTALSKAKQPLLDAIAKTDLEVLDVLWYGDDATFEHVDRLLKEKPFKTQISFSASAAAGLSIRGKSLPIRPIKPSLPSRHWPRTVRRRRLFPSCTKKTSPLPAIITSISQPVHTFIDMAVIADRPLNFSGPALAMP